jgi:hypothetical protein
MAEQTVRYDCSQQADRRQPAHAAGSTRQRATSRTRRGGEPAVRRRDLRHSHDDLHAAPGRYLATGGRGALRPATARMPGGHAADRRSHPGSELAHDLFPAMREFALPHVPSLAQLRRELLAARMIPFWFDDLPDASIATLCPFPEAMLDQELRRQNSFFGRLERKHARQIETGLTTLRSWLGSGRRPEQERVQARSRLGDGSVIAWQAALKAQ